MAEEGGNVVLRKKDEALQSDGAMDQTCGGGGGGDTAEEFIKQLQRLSTVDQQAVQKYMKHLSLFDHGKVQVNAGTGQGEGSDYTWKKAEPFPILAPEFANAVRKVDKGKRDEQIEAVLEWIGIIQKKKMPSGLILDKDNPMKGSITIKQEAEGCGKMADVLGKGNSAGEVTVFKDKSGQEMALKTVMISQFNPNEVRLWVHLGDLKLAPKLYHFELVGNKLYFTMEIMSGKDLQEVIDEDMWTLTDPSLARDFSLCILHDLLETWEEIRSQHYVHADMHAGNWRLEKSMNVKIFDFGRARNLLDVKKPDAKRLIKQDIVGIIRVFCALYSGYDFNDVFHAMKVLEAKNLKELDDNMIRLTEDTRKELYHIMTLLFDTVSKSCSSPTTSPTTSVSPSFGDTRGIISHVESLLSSKDMTDIKKGVARIIFPPELKNKTEECEPVPKTPKDQVDSMPQMRDLEDPTDFDLDPIWDDPDMEEYIRNVSDARLEELDSF